MRTKENNKKQPNNCEALLNAEQKNRQEMKKITATARHEGRKYKVFLNSVKRNKQE